MVTDAAPAIWPDMTARQRRIVLLHTLMMAATAFWALIGCFLLRMPNGGPASVMGPMLSSAGAFGETGRARRTRRLILNLITVAAVNVIQINVAGHRLVSVAVMFALAMLVHKAFGNAQASSAIMVGSVLELHPTPWILSVEYALTMLSVMPFAAWSYYLFDRQLLGDDDASGFVQVPGLTWESAFRRSLAFAIGYYLTKATDMTQSHWIIFTIGLAYSSGDVGFKPRQIALLRCFWAPLGLTLGILLLYATGFQSAQLDYLTLLLGVLAYWILYRTGNYSYYYLTFLLMATMEYNWATGIARPYDDNFNYVVQSTAMIFLGTAIVYLLELRPAHPPNENNEV